jgi:hypothetical protein
MLLTVARGRRHDQLLHHGVALEFGDRRQQTASMTHSCNAEFLEIFRRQLMQQIGADLILAERRLVSFKTERS